MAETCSSNTSNGCRNCGPNLSLWTISEGSISPVQGFGCLNGEPLQDPFGVYKSKFTKMTGSSESSNASSDLWAHHQFNSSSSSSINSSQIYEYKVSPYGSILVGLRSISTSRYQAAGGGGGSVAGVGIAENAVAYCGLFNLNASDLNDFNSTPKIECDSEGQEYLINIDSGESRTISAGCGGWCFRGQCYAPSPPNCDTACQDPGIYNESTGPGSFMSASAEIVSCTQAISFIQSDNQNEIAACMENCPPSCCNADYLDGERFTETSSNSNSSISLSDAASKDFFYGLAKQSVDKKTGISKENKPRNCKKALCGSGEKDDCWHEPQIGDFYLPSKPTAKKLLIKLGIKKEDFDKEYKSVSGKGIFYYGGTNGKTPCCNDDFDGTVVKEQSYSISAGSNFKKDYYANDGGEMSNESLEDQQIHYCYTIDNVSFIE